MASDGGTDAKSGGLAEIADLLWAARDVDAVAGSDVADLPSGQRYLPFPPGRPRFLVPLEGARVAAGSVVPNLGLRKRRERIPRRILAAGLRSGLIQKALRSQWEGVRTAPDLEPLVDVLRREWNPQVAALSFSIRAITPNYKPTFVALDARGRALGFAKVAVDEGTHERLAAEIDALTWMGDHDVPGLRTPRLLADVAWLDCRIAVVEPLPDDVGRYPIDRHAPVTLVRDAQARGRTRSVQALASELIATVTGSEDGELAAAAQSFAGAVVADHGGREVAVGRTHGDWVPWNLALRRTDTWAWDWEHSVADGAVVLDLVVWHQLVCQFRGGLSFEDSLITARHRIADDLARLGMTGEDVEAVLRLGLLHLAGRNAGLAAASGQWREGVREGILRLLVDDT